MAAIVLLLAIPMTALYQLAFEKGAEALVHVVLGTGCLLLSFSVFDFKTARWIGWAGCVATSGLAAIFFLQTASELIRNDSLADLVYRVLGQRLEAWLADVFLLWCIAVLLITSHGKTRILGVVALSVPICLQAYSSVMSFVDASFDAQSPGLKLSYLLPFVWLLFESKKKLRAAEVGDDLDGS